MKSATVQEIVVVVVNETVSNTEELVEALFLWPEITMGAKVPLTVERGAIAGRLQRLGQRHLSKGHVDTIRSHHVALRPVMYPTPLRMPTRHQRRPRRATHRVRIGLREPHSRGRKSVDIGRLEVTGAIAIGINRSLVVGKQYHHIGPFSGIQLKAQGTDCECTKPCPKNLEESKLGHFYQFLSLPVPRISGAFTRKYSSQFFVSAPGRLRSSAANSSMVFPQ